MTDHENVGYLTWDDFERFRKAVNKSIKLIPWLRAAGYVRGESDEIRSPSSNHPLGMPPTWIAAQEIERLQGELKYWADLEDVANDDYGKDVAMQLTREVETSLARWPVEDKPHKVRHLRCQQCAGETLQYDPPEFDGEEVRIECTECHSRLTEEEFKVLAELVGEEMKIGRARRLGAA